MKSIQSSRYFPLKQKLLKFPKICSTNSSSCNSSKYLKINLTEPIDLSSCSLQTSKLDASIQLYQHSHPRAKQNAYYDVQKISCLKSKQKKNHDAYQMRLFNLIQQMHIKKRGRMSKPQSFYQKNYVKQNQTKQENQQILKKKSLDILKRKQQMSKGAKLTRVIDQKGLYSKSPSPQKQSLILKITKQAKQTRKRIIFNIHKKIVPEEE